MHACVCVCSVLLEIRLWQVWLFQMWWCANMKKKLGHWTFYIYDQSSQSMLLCIALAIFTSTCKQQCDFYCLCMCVAATLRHAVCFMTVLWWSQAWTAIRVKFCHISSFCTDGNPISLILLWSHLTLTHIFHAMLEKSKAYCPAGMGDRQWCLITPSPHPPTKLPPLSPFLLCLPPHHLLL